MGNVVRESVYVRERERTREKERDERAGRRSKKEWRECGRREAWVGKFKRHFMTVHQLQQN